ncbi:hypothetical protein AGMMS50256_24420 [Betaproteobacteria bacterium]|nr:hypothetical protein AGMMS50256_24420 [Betaproteobacteria bacterium]
MDPNLIYVKTASGEDAIQQRTLVIQRNVRMVLILVDGQSSVADLTHKIGNLQLTENALVELEKGGFIELKQDSLWAESQLVAQEIRASAIEKAMQLPPKEENYERHSTLKQPISPPSTLLPTLDETDFRDSDTPIPLQSTFFDATDEVGFSTSRFSLPPGMDDVSEEPISARDAAKKRKKDNSEASEPSFWAQLKSMWSSADRVLDDKPAKPDKQVKPDKPLKPVKVKPVRYRARRVTSWTALLFFGFVGVVVLGCATVLLFPFNIFIPELETAFSSAIGRPVSIQEIRVNVHPEPGLVLGGVQLGQGNDAFRIRELNLQPDLMSLFSERKGFRKVVVSGTELQLERINQMPVIFAALSDPYRSPKIGAILLKSTDITFSGIVLKEADAEIQRNSSDRMQALVARTTDKSFTLTAEPTATGTNLTVEAFAWPTDAGSRFFSDSLNFKGRLEKDTLMISGLEIRIFDGLIKGDAIVQAGGVGPNLSGTVTFERINASKLVETLGIGKKLVGSIAGNMQFTMNSKTWPTILSSIYGEGEFSLQRGDLYGFDLAEVVRSGSRIPRQGGMTTFEQMSGRIRLTQEKAQFYDLSISLGLMQSTGHIDVAKDGRLAGNLDMRIKGSVNQIRIPVQVTGTLNASAVQVQSGR